MSVYQATATRKRPKTFQNLIGQDFVSTTLQESIKKGTISHTYLFSGPRGVGKTSSARALARCLNCEKGPTIYPCGTCVSCLAMDQGSSLNIIEIDGASHTSIQDIREIREDIRFAPNGSRYRIYIIDEVHMLSNSAFNGLLKTLEEPPSYVIFILATTELHKIPATVKSRCQQFHFNLISFDHIVKLLKQVCEERGIYAEEEALIWIAKMSTGSLRDAYTLFDQVLAFSKNEIRLLLIQEKLGLLSLDKLRSFVLSLAKGETQTVVETLHSFLQNGIALEQVLNDLSEYLRSLMLFQSGIRAIEILGARAGEFDIHIQQYWSQTQLETALSYTFETHRRLRYCLNPCFEIELMLCQLCQLRYYLSPKEIWQEIKTLEINLSKKGLEDKIVKDSLQQIDSITQTMPPKETYGLITYPSLEELYAFVSHYVPELASLPLDFYQVNESHKTITISLSPYEKKLWQQKQDLIALNWPAHWAEWIIDVQEVQISEKEKIINRVQDLFKGEYLGEEYDTE